MTGSRMTLRCVLVIGLCVLAACGDAGPEIVLEIETPASTQIVTGDLLALSVNASGSIGAITWTSSDPSRATVVGGTVEALRPGPVTIEASARNAVPAEVGLTVVERPGGYSAEEIDYFVEIAFGAEFGGGTPLLRRWRGSAPPTIRINGSPTATDLEVVDSVVAEINRIAPVGIELVADAPSVEMHFVPEDEFVNILPQAPAGNVGLVWVWWGGDQYLFQSVVLIATDISQSFRDHIIREELTQMLGLLRDSFLYPESIFYQNFSTVTEYLPIDQTVIELLHRPELTVGMTTQQAARGARLLLKADAPLATTPGLGPKTGRVLAREGIRAWPPLPIDSALEDARRRPGSAGGGAQRR